jgi:hypothetical protein
MPVRLPRSLLPDAVFLVLLGAFWVYYVTPIVTPEQRHSGDILRDLAAALNVQQGQVFADPAYRGETIWYPPLSSVIVAGVSALLRISPADCYVWSQLLFNWMVPAGLYLVVRSAWGRRAALASTVALLLAVPWWQTSVCRGQASVHALVWAWVALGLYGRQHQHDSLGWAVGCGLFQGLSCWHHPVLPAVLTLAFVGQAAWAALGRKDGLDAPVAARRLLGREACILGVTLLAAAPILYLMLHGPVLNPEPHEYVADELRSAEFPLMRYNLWIWAMGLIGLVRSARGRDAASRLLIVGTGICAVAQLPGYARVFGLPGSSHLPVVVPHEFQMLFQLGWAIGVGVGIDAILEWCSRRHAWTPRGLKPAVRDGVLLLLALVLTGAWGMSDVKVNLRRFLHHYGSRDPAFRAAADWVRRNTDINDLFMCDADLAFAWLSPQTGRKVWVTGHGHANPRVDWYGRVWTLEKMSELTSPQAFWRMARDRGVDYCIPSPGWLPRVLTDPELGPMTVPTRLEPVFVAGKVHILKVVEPVGLPAGPETNRPLPDPPPP